MADIAKTPTAASSVDHMYQRRGESVVSTTGDQSHFSQLMSALAATRNALSVMLTPWREARNVRATPTNPLMAPNGASSTLQTIGWHCGAADSFMRQPSN